MANNTKMHRTLVLLVCSAISATAAEVAQSNQLASTVCAACHGANGVSVASGVPHLAGQRSAYVAKQLNDYKANRRRHSLMNSVTAGLAASEISKLAHYYANLPGVPLGAPNSKPPRNFISKRIRFSGDLSGFTLYMSFNHERRKERRSIYANKIALVAARAGKPLPDGSVIVVEKFKAQLDQDGKPIKNRSGAYIADRRAGYSVMERRAEWGRDFPELIRNDNWQYGVFEADGSARSNVNQASCLVCHKPQAQESYLFTLKALEAKARE